MTSKITDSTLAAEIQGEDGTLIIDHIAPIESIGLTIRTDKQTIELAGSQEELDMVYEINEFVQMIQSNDRLSFEKWMNRSIQVAKWTEIARKQNGILFPGE
ncbi:hypothetical protein [Ornithinibacillus contaminans]|uniref:hypothetical protein n=1 Tax=Ornithinibacillus contaminans TaxID=694055 RepID=UPI0009F86D6F|nr:hypothetical protein [Ornithinibacillus contaminans]